VELGEADGRPAEGSAVEDAVGSQRTGCLRSCWLLAAGIGLALLLALLALWPTIYAASPSTANLLSMVLSLLGVWTAAAAVVGRLVWIVRMDPPHTGPAMIEMGIVSGLGFLVLNLWPDLLCWAVIPLLLASLPAAIFGIVLLIQLLVLLRREPARAVRPLVSAVVGLVLFFSCVAVVLVFRPEKAVFRLTSSSFQAVVDSPPPSRDDRIPVGRWLGVWFVEECRTDGRGGTYFPIATRAAILGPHTWGFAHLPDQAEPPTPYGCDFGVEHIAGDWYWFHAWED
jgi:hypothetical protein